MEMVSGTRGRRQTLWLQIPITTVSLTASEFGIYAQILEVNCALLNDCDGDRLCDGAS